MINIRALDFQKWAVVSLLILWVSTPCSIALMEISFVVALVFWALYKLKERRAFKIHEFDRALWAPLALFFIVVLASFFTSEYPKQSFRGIFKIAKPLLTFLMVGDLFRDEKTRQRFDLAFLITFLAVMIDSSTQYAFGRDLLRFIPPENSSAGLRIVGPFGNFAKMAAYLVLVIPVLGMRSWSDFQSPELRKKSFYGLALALSGLVLLYLTRCRGPLVALALSLGILCIYKRRFKALGIITLLCLTILAIAPQRVIIHQDAQGKEQSIAERFVLWRRALDVIEAKPWTGTGINTYNVAHERYDKEQNWRVRGYYAHNGYLQMTAEIGLPGIFFFLLFLVMFFRRAFGSLTSIRGSSEEYARLGLITGLLAFLIYAAADNNLQSPPSLMLFWYLAGVLLSRLGDSA
jgi:O-antigen ligase